MSLLVLEKGQETFLTVGEIETLLGFPEHHTDCANLSVTCRRKVLGKSWSVHVVMDILKPLSSLYAKEDISV